MDFWPGQFKHELPLTKMGRRYDTFREKIKFRVRHVRTERLI